MTHWTGSASLSVTIIMGILCVKGQHTTQFAVIILKYTQNTQHRASFHPKPQQISGSPSPSLLVLTLDLFNLRAERTPGSVHHRAAVFRKLIGIISVHWRRTSWDDLPSQCGPHTQKHTPQGGRDSVAPKRPPWAPINTQSFISPHLLIFKSWLQIKYLCISRERADLYMTINYKKKHPMAWSCSSVSVGGWQ